MNVNLPGYFNTLEYFGCLETNGAPTQKSENDDKFIHGSESQILRGLDFESCCRIQKGDGNDSLQINSMSPGTVCVVHTKPSD